MTNCVIFLCKVLVNPSEGQRSNSTHISRTRYKFKNGNISGIWKKHQRRQRSKTGVGVDIKWTKSTFCAFVMKVKENIMLHLLSKYPYCHKMGLPHQRDIWQLRCLIWLVFRVDDLGIYLTVTRDSWKVKYFLFNYFSYAWIFKFEILLWQIHYILALHFVKGVTSMD